MTEPKIRIVPVHPSFLDEVWDDFVRFMAPSIAVTKGKYSVDSVRSSIEAGQMVLWAVFNAGVVTAFYTTRMVEYPGARAMSVDWVGGKDMSAWLAAIDDAIKTHARRNNCTHLEGYGRKAWGRALQTHGWKQDYIAYRMELSDG